MKKTIVTYLASIAILVLSACSGAGSSLQAVTGAVQVSTNSTSETVLATAVEATDSAASTLVVDYDSEDLESDPGSALGTTITLQGDTIQVAGSGASAQGSILTITEPGTYTLSGVLNNGQVIVDSPGEGTVILLLDGVDLTCQTSAPIYILNADKAIITLADGSTNRVADGSSYVYAQADADEPNAAIFSKDDLTINGSGSLTVQANFNHGIVSKDDLKITGGNITIEAVNDGLKGKDSIAIKYGTLTITAGGDGLQSTNDSDPEKGYIVIEGGILTITTDLDGIVAETNLLVSGGDITIVSGGGSVNTSHTFSQGDMGRGGKQNTAQAATDTESTKGMKAGLDLAINGGTLQIDAADDALHSDGTLSINGGDLTLASGDDGVHAETSLTINAGELDITQSYEGLESTAITLNGGSVHLVASDDGVNASSGSGSGGGFGPGMFESGDDTLIINGGYLFVSANGDGLDVNGPIEMNAGMVIVIGPISNGNGALDYTGFFNLNGGTLVAVGSAGMAQAPSASSNQYSLIHIFESSQAAGTLFHIESQDGGEIVSFVASKAYQAVVVSTPDLHNGETYLVYSGGSHSGTASDGLYSGGSYTAGTQVTSFTINSMVTSSGITGGGFMGGGRQGGPRP